MLDDLLEGALVLGTGGRLLYANEAARRELGCLTDASIGQPVREACPVLAESGVVDRLDVSVSASRPAQFLEAWTAEDGNTHWFEVRVRSLAAGKLVLFQDVTARRAADGAVRKRQVTEARLAAIVRQMPGLVWTLDRGLRFTSSQGAALVDLGLAPDEVVGVHLHDYLSTTDPSHPAIVAHRAALDGTSSAFEITFADRFYSCWTEPLREPSGVVGGVVGVAFDITDRAAALRSAQEAWERTTAALEATGDMIALFRAVRGPEGRLSDAEFLFANRETRHRLLGGGPADAVVGLRLFERLPALRPVLFDLYETVAEQGRPVRALREVESIDGQRVIELVVTPFEGGFAHVGRDVTDERRSRAELEASEDRLRRTLEGVDAIVSYQEDGDRPFAVLSPQVERILGYAPAELAAFDDWNGRIHPDDRERCLGVILGPQNAWDLEYRMRHRDGHWVWVADRGRRVSRGGAPPASFSVITDVTERHELETQLRQAQRLEAIGELAGGIAHDFNNVLAAVTGYSELAMAELPPVSAARADVGEVLRAADRAARLTRQLLAFGRRRSMERQIIAPAELIDDLLPMLRRLLGEHIELVASHAPGRLTVLGDAGQLEQVVLNLAVNARDAMPGGGRLTIRTSRTSALPLRHESVSVAKPVPGMKIVVSDEGVGMDQDTLAHAFEPFFTTKGPGQGTGLGLATVRGIVEQLGGTIDVTSSPGAGTTFTIVLPVSLDETDGAPESREPSDAAAAPIPAATILLVEDEDAIRKLSARFLAPLGHRVLAVGSAHEALQVLQAEPVRIDLLVTDIRMPGMQGPDLARHLRQGSPSLPVLFVSALAEDAIESFDIDDASVSLLRKPFERAAFVRAVEEALTANRGPRGA